MAEDEKSFISSINNISEKLPLIEKAVSLFNTDVVALLDDLSGLEVQEMVDDLKKGNYLGNRKLDIQLAKNNSSETSYVAYQQVRIVLNSGQKIDIPFEVATNTGLTAILELTSHSDIKEYILDSVLWQTKIINTEMIIEEAINDTSTMIRFRDADGFSSNIIRVELFVFGGDYKEAQPAYTWTDTTSSFQVLANRTAELIALGKNISVISALADKEAQLDELYLNGNKLYGSESLYSNLGILKTLEGALTDYLTPISNDLNSNNYIGRVAENKPNIDTLATKMNEMLAVHAKLTEIAAAPAILIETKEARDEATTFLEEYNTLKLEVQILAENQPANISRDTETNTITLSVPKGEKGERGEAFKPDEQGGIAGRNTYDDGAKGFSYLATDEGNLYFKNSSSTADWSAGIAFGKGDKGDTGLKGAKGDTGDTGLKGDTGDTGLKGDAGDTGQKGDVPEHSWSDTSIRFQNPNGSWGFFTNLKGDMGNTGERGLKGDMAVHNWSGTSIRFQNPDGSWGNYTNLKGSTGSQGPQGNTGAKGTTGNTGAKGNKGDTGTSVAQTISSVVVQKRTMNTGTCGDRYYIETRVVVNGKYSGYTRDGMPILTVQSNNNW
jgi:hypothetical protein